MHYCLGPYKATQLREAQARTKQRTALCPTVSQQTRMSSGVFQSSRLPMFYRPVRNTAAADVRRPDNATNCKLKRRLLTITRFCYSTKSDSAAFNGCRYTVL